MRSPSLTPVILSALCLGAVAVPVAADEVTQISTGTFQDADRRHQGAGSATLVVTDGGVVQLQLGEDFAVTPGPDLEVWLIDGDVPNTSADVLEQDYLSLGPLQSPEGAQVYDLPSGPLGEDYEAAIIWCEDFGVLFAIAALAQ